MVKICDFILSLVKKDKLAHFIVGQFIFVLFYWAFSQRIQAYIPHMAFIVVMFLAALKEFLDYYVKGTSPDEKDFIATLLGALFIIFVQGILI